MLTATDFRSLSEDELMKHANLLLHGRQADQLEIYDLARVLKNRWKRFGRARQLLWRARSDSKDVLNKSSNPDFIAKLRQQHALCTYKDNDLPADVRFDRALEILDQNRDLATTKDPETLGQAGAIFKGKWETFGQVQDLQRSLFYYQRGADQGTDDDGYTANNTAYLLDLIAYQEDLQASQAGASGQASGSAQHRARARKLREKLIQVLPDLATKLEARIAANQEPEKREDIADRLYWVYVTLGEAYLGLGLAEEGNFKSGSAYLQKAAALDRYDWMVESTARQLTSLARLQASGSADADAWKYLSVLLKDQADGVRTAFIGKVGLALSGGGFRASLFHIGVLARLAEMNVLRHVEYLSCVSGGSILGAYYYMEVRNLLQRKNDNDITREDYVEIVKRMEKEFLAGVQQNVRVRSLTSVKTNFHHDPMLGVLPTERTAELYDECLFKRIQYNTDDPDPNKRETVPKYMDDLVVSPGRYAGGASDGREFRPKDENWRRKNKVPILVLNCTTLNTGHNWQFTATWMGEPPATINDEVDANKRLRRMYYSEAPDAHKKVLISRAVAASASVPALFAPLALEGLYKDMTVRLADGGVHDNQGVASLLEQACLVLLVSDASGQLPDETDPGKVLPQIAMRSSDISQERVRVSEYQDLESRLRSSLLRNLMFVHLRKDLDSEPLDWVGCKEPNDASDEARSPAAKGVLTSYGVHKKVQARLAAIRTDLDSFHEAEAYALMASGYNMADAWLDRNLKEAQDLGGKREAWRFLKLQDELTEANEPFIALLKESSQRLFKVWDLVPFLRALRWGLIVLVALLGIALLAWLFFMQPPKALVTSDWLAKTLIGILLAAFLGKTMAWLINPRSALRKLAFRAGASGVTAFLARIHLRFFDPLYLSAGSLAKVVPSALQGDPPLVKDNAIKAPLASTKAAD
jgi:predicted acylesterase/phospholipase RssA